MKIYNLGRRNTMINDFMEGLGKGLLVLVILAFAAVLGYATGSIIGNNPQITSAGFVVAALVSGVVSVIRGRW